MGSSRNRDAQSLGLLQTVVDLMERRSLLRGECSTPIVSIQRLSVSLCLLILILTSGCGADYSQLSASSVLNADGVSSGATTKVRDVTMKTDGVPVIEPSNIPVSEPAGRKIRFQMKLTIQVSSGTPPFLYRSRNWVVVISKPGGVAPRTFRSSTKEAESQLRIITDGFAGDSGEAVLTEAQTQPLEFEIDLKEGEWEIIRSLADSTEESQRRYIQIQAVYTEKETIPAKGSDTDGTIYVDEPAKMQNDEGLIADGASVRVAGASSGSVTLEFTPPSTTSAILPSLDYKVIGDSILSGYLVMYWKDSDCQASGWDMQSHPQYRKDRESGESLLNCSYPGLSAMANVSDGSDSRCPFGCGFNATQNYYTGARNPVDEDVAIPVDEPGHCYRIVRVPAGRSSFSISGLENNETYGFVAWPLDNAGTPGDRRSSCVQAVPLKVPMAAAVDTEETVRDCFVASAASGSPSSLTVHYWRILRDRYLDAWGFSPWYYRHAPAMAHWLERHAYLKAPVNAVLLFWGETFVTLSDWWTNVSGQFAEMLSNFRTQISSAAFAADAELNPEDVPTKALPEPSVDHSQDNEQPTKTLPVQSSQSEGEQEAPSKVLPASAVEDNQAELGKKVLPDSAIPSDTEPPPPVYPRGSASGFFRLGFGYLKPERTTPWQTFYPSGDPYQVHLARSFRVIDLMGELALGMALSYQAHTGRVPEVLADGSPVNSLLVGQKIGFYSVGLAALAEYRWRYVPFPPVAPRLAVSYGWERLRETSRSEFGSGSSGDQDESRGAPGYTLLKSFVLLGGGLDFSLGGIFGSQYQGLSLGYGAKDILVTFDAGQKVDLSGHQFTQSGQYLMGSFVLAFE